MRGLLGTTSILKIPSRGHNVNPTWKSMSVPEKARLSMILMAAQTTLGHAVLHFWQPRLIYIYALTHLRPVEDNVTLSKPMLNTIAHMSNGQVSLHTASYALSRDPVESLYDSQYLLSSRSSRINIESPYNMI